MRLHGHVHVATGTKKSRPVAYQRRGDLWQGGVAPPPRLWQPPALCLSGGQRAHMLQIFEPPSSVKATWPQQFLLSDLWLSRCAPRHHTATCWCAALNCCWLPGSFFCAMSSSSASPWILSLTSRTCGRAERCNGVDASSPLCDRRGPAACAVCTGRAKIPSLSWAQLLQLLCCGKLLPSCGDPVHRRLAQLFCPCFLAGRESHAKEKDRRVCGCHHSGGSWSDVGTGAFEGGYSERAQRLRVVSRWFNESLLQVIPT